MHDMIKKWANFSDSETKPLFWMLLGPLLIILTMTLSTSPFLPAVTTLGVILSWHYRLKGFALTLMVFTLFLSFRFSRYEVSFWELGWGLSLALGLTISFLSMEELRSYYAKQRRAKEKAVADLQLSLQGFEEKTAIESRVQEKEIETLKEELHSSRSEVEALLNLVEVSQIESDKTHKQSDGLIKESLEMHREIEILKDKLDGQKERLAFLEKEHATFAELSKERLKTLNTYRVELHQARALNETYQKQLQKAREYFRSQKKVAPPQTSNQKGVLEALEKDKGRIKESYDQILESYQTLRTSLEEKKATLAKAPDEALAFEVEKLTLGVKERKKIFEKTKSELVSLEREIFVIKKGLQEEGALG
ncbi:hypothetical protein [Candidatus Neptunochlamydia vexilliferae]|uniref:Uncharacterized protein n=1 Tax=Candidatus Neptunichlamydia vexilliferae TaxID=1651774 RepID=A0ABS0B0K4_9BACT|nr:hypothetical protein [Candidatus Neptunochlamydia vexilliferae]MBF5059724.1 hypothetical protein [Candidatus Neptunochlamydia vexilliferae]